MNLEVLTQGQWTLECPTHIPPTSSLQPRPLTTHPLNLYPQPQPVTQESLYLQGRLILRESTQVHG